MTKIARAIRFLGTLCGVCALVLMSPMVGDQVASAAKQEAPENCFKGARDKLEAAVGTAWDPKVFDRLRRVLNLFDDKELTWVDTAFENTIAKYKTPAEFLNKIQECAAQNTYLADFMCGKEAVLNITNEPETFGLVLKDAVHYSFLLEALTSAIRDDDYTSRGESLARKLKDAFMEKRGMTWWWGLDWFMAVKIKSIDPGFADFINYKEQKVPVRKSYANWGLAMNILEAMTKDWQNRYEDNAWSAYPLAENYGGRPNIGGNKVINAESRDLGKGVVGVRPPYGKQWVDLYQTWNMAFVFTSFPEYPYYLGKLFAPSVLCYAAGTFGDSEAGETYLYNRIIALYITLHWIMLNEKEGHLDAPPWTSMPMKWGKFHDWRDETLSRAWGKKNKESSENYQLELAKVFAKSMDEKERVSYDLARQFVKKWWRRLMKLAEWRRGKEAERCDFAFNPANQVAARDEAKPPGADDLLVRRGANHNDPKHKELTPQYSEAEAGAFEDDGIQVGDPKYQRMGVDPMIKLDDKGSAVPNDDRCPVIK